MTLLTSTEQPALSLLPKTFAIELSKFGAISLQGEDQSKYLQGQVTCDVNNSQPDTLQIGAHCDAKGKVFSVFRLINRIEQEHSAHLLLQPKSTIDASLKELKKFGVFAKVSIEESTNLSFFALVGEQATNLLQEVFSQVPDSLSPVIQVGSTTIVYTSGTINRYLLIDEESKLRPIIKALSLPIYQHNIWDLLEISQGFPLLSESSTGQYVPQMLNLQAINGISFTKGCYLGQETVARMQYLGKNKRALFILETQSAIPLSGDDIIEKQLGDNWRKAGDILATYQADDGKCFIQAILSNDEEQILRIKSQENSSVVIKDLPYTLIDKEL
jgi:folate-binding protein YgfZ